jgi:phosphate transport system substrate-binding protein
MNFCSTTWESQMLFRNFLLVVFYIATATVMSAGGGGEQRQVIQNKGSDTLVNVAQAWAEAYQGVKPDVVVAVSGGGSGTGFAALINGTVDIANASRAMKDK